MKRALLIFISGLLALRTIANDKPYVYRPSTTPMIKKEQLAKAEFLSDIMPGFKRNFVIPFKDRMLFQHQENLLPKQDIYGNASESYDQILDVVSAEIKLKSNGTMITLKSKTDSLTTEQKETLTKADIGADIHIYIRYKFKYSAGEIGNDIKEGEYKMILVPDKQAEFPCGFTGLSGYINQCIFDQVKDPKLKDKLWNAIVTFTISESGKLVNIKIVRSTNDAYLDKQVRDAIGKMPLWKPAEDEKGLKICEDFTLAFGNEEGC